MEPGGQTFPCLVVAVAGTWVLLAAADRTAQLPAWIDGDVYLVFFESVYPIRLRGRVEPGRVPGELRFTTVSSIGHHPEPREAPRVNVTLSASILTADGHMIDGEVLDISAGGLKLRYHESLAAGATARVRLQLLDGPLIDVDVEVANLRPGSSSVRFLHFRAGSAQEVAEWCMDHLRAGARDP